jgi:hypothetical protein
VRRRAADWVRGTHAAVDDLVESDLLDIRHAFVDAAGRPAVEEVGRLDRVARLS